MAVSDGKVIRLRKKMGLVKEVFTDLELDGLPGNIAVGHVRYPTKGSATEFNTQPHMVETLAGPSYALASNGDLVNYHAMRRHLEEQNVYFKSDNDGELLVKYIAWQVMRRGEGIIEAIRHLMRDIKARIPRFFVPETRSICSGIPIAFAPWYGERWQMVALW
jgi:amidophosphoribosyltransferase